MKSADRKVLLLLGPVLLVLVLAGAFREKSPSQSAVPFVQDTPVSTAQVVQAGFWVACQDTDQLAQIETAAPEQRAEVAARFVGAGCAILPPGTPVTVEDYTATLKRVRPAGASGSYWLPIEAARVP